MLVIPLRPEGSFSLFFFFSASIPKTVKVPFGFTMPFIKGQFFERFDDFAIGTIMLGFHVNFSD